MVYPKKLILLIFRIMNHNQWNMRNALSWDGEFSIIPTLLRPNCSICEKLVQSLKFYTFEKWKVSQDILRRKKCPKFQPNWTVLRPPRLSQSSSRVLQKTRPQAPKIKIFEKWKKHSQIFSQGTSVQNFSQSRQFLNFLWHTDKQIHTHWSCFLLKELI